MDFDAFHETFAEFICTQGGKNILGERNNNNPKSIKTKLLGELFFLRNDSVMGRYDYTALTTLLAKENMLAIIQSIIIPIINEKIIISKGKHVGNNYSIIIQYLFR